jgi:hypothetical protein
MKIHHGSHTKKLKFWICDLYVYDPKCQTFLWYLVLNFEKQISISCSKALIS